MPRESMSAENRIWRGMLSRCRNPNTKDYKDYGARGIKVCDRWHSFMNFLADMGRRPSPSHTLERVNNAGGYEPSNCRWATRAEQGLNQRRRRDNASGVTGVIWKPRNRKWEAYISFRRERIYLGLFDSIESATAARIAKAAELGFNPGHGAPR